MNHTMRAQIELRERILGGAFPPGARLTEVPLAEDLGISRTPVREAMARLVEEGLLERAQSGGFRVRRFSFSDVVDSIELRGVLEGTAARLAAERGVSRKALAQIREVAHELDLLFATGPDGLDLEAYSTGNSRFHAMLWGLSGSEIIRRETERVTALPFASPTAFTPDRTSISNFRRSLIIAQEQHHLIIDAIESREGTRAEMLAREHARGARRNLEHLKSDSDAISRLSLIASNAVALA